MTTTSAPTVTFEPVETTLDEVPTALRYRIERKLKALTKRLAKLDVPAPTIEYGPIVDVEYPLVGDAEIAHFFYGDWDASRPTYTAYETVTVKGFEAKVAGWTGLAVLDWTVNPDEAFVARFPGHDDEDSAAEVPDEIRTRGPLCDHCGKVRSRNNTVLFEHEDGALKAVGTSCVVEYLGVDPRTILMLRDFVSDVSDADEDEFYAKVKPSIDPVEYVAVAAEVTRAVGFVRSAETNSTKDLVTMLAITGPSTKAEREEARALADEIDLERGRAKAAAIAEWLAADPGTSDFIRSAKVALNGNAVEAASRHAGLLAALPFSHDRHLGLVAEREAKRKAEAEARAAGGFVGEVGDKITVTGEIVFYNTYETNYSYYSKPKARVTVLTDTGDRVTTFGSGDSLLWDWAVGDKVEMTGKVKGHDDEAKWGKSTVLERAKLVELDENGNKVLAA